MISSTSSLFAIATVLAMLPSSSMGISVMPARLIGPLQPFTIRSQTGRCAGEHADGLVAFSILPNDPSDDGASCKDASRQFTLSERGHLQLDGKQVVLYNRPQGRLMYIADGSGLGDLAMFKFTADEKYLQSVDDAGQCLTSRAGLLTIDDCHAVAKDHLQSVSFVRPKSK